MIIFSQQKYHLIKLSRCWLGTKIAFAGDCTYVHMIRQSKAYWLTYHDWHHMWDEVYWIPTFIYFGIPNFGIGIPIFQFFNSGIRKKNPTGIFGIKNGIGNPLPMGVPEIGTKNWNSQPRWQYCKSCNWESNQLIEICPENHFLRIKMP